GLAAARRSQQRHGLAGLHGHRQRLHRMHGRAPARQVDLVDGVEAEDLGRAHGRPAPLTAFSRWPLALSNRMMSSRADCRPTWLSASTARSLDGCEARISWPSPVFSSVTRRSFSGVTATTSAAMAPAAAGPILIASGRTPSRLA